MGKHTQKRKWTHILNKPVLPTSSQVSDTVHLQRPALGNYKYKNGGKKKNIQLTVFGKV